MKRALALIPILALALTGCVSATGQAPAPDPETQNDCLTLSDGAVDSLQKHLDAKGPEQSILHIAAVPSPDSDGWFVAATVDSQGDEVEAVWMTTNDPTADGENAYASVDAMAETISDYLRPNGFTITMPGAQKALDCLN